MMKILKSLALVFMALAAFSCAKNGGSEVGNGERALSISIKTQKTRAIDAPVADGSKTGIGSLYIYLTDGTTVLDRDIVSDAAAVAEFVKDGKTYASIPSAVSEVLIVANKKDSDNFPTANGSSVAAIKGYAFALAAQQPDVAENKGAEYVTMMAASGLTPDGTTAEGVTKVKAEVILQPVVGRLEIDKAMKPGTGIHEIVVEQIWVNNYYKSANYDAANLLLNGIEIVDYAANLKNTFGKDSENLNKITTGGQADAYHLFSNNKAEVTMPHVVIKVSGTYDNGTGGPGAAFADKYLTIKKYRGTDGNLVGIFMANNIYKVSLDNLTIKASDIDNTPEAEDVALEVSIQVKSWIAQVVTPEI